MAEVGQPGVFRPDPVGERQRFIQAEMRVVRTITHGVERHVVEPLEFCHLFFRKAAEIGQIGDFSYPESKNRHLSVNPAYGNDPYSASIIFGIFDIVCGGRLNASVRHFIAISDVMHPYQFLVFG